MSTTIERNCNECQGRYKAQTRYLARGQGYFCSRACSGSYNGKKNTKKRTPNVVCALCNAEFWLAESKQKLSKSGLFFCSRAHKDHAQRLNGISAIHPTHYGAGSGISTYRRDALAAYPNVCAVCGWGDYVEVLEINHKDCNRLNNDLSNLEILCPTHHNVFHFLDGSGKWRRRDSNS